VCGTTGIFPCAGVTGIFGLLVDQMRGSAAVTCTAHCSRRRGGHPLVDPQDISDSSYRSGK